MPLLRWHQKAPPFYITTKRGGVGCETKKSSDCLLKKEGLVGKVGVWMSAMQPDT